MGTASAMAVTTRARTAAADRPAPSANRWLALTVVCLSVTVIVLDNTIMNVALPSIERSLNASASELQWVVDAYTLVFAALLLTAGTVGDRFGRRGTLMTGLAIFGAGSAFAAFSTNATALIGFRALMGIGAAAIYPTTLSIITNMFEGNERGRAIGIWAALAGAGVALGPILGGLLLDHWWWGSVLLVNVPIVALSLILLPLLVPTSRDPNAPRLDLVGVVLSAAGFTALLYGIIEGPHNGWTSPAVLGTLVAGVVVLGAFLLWERHTDHPMLNLSFFRNPRFSAASVALSLTFFALFGYIFLLTQYLQFVRNLTPLGAGLRLAPPAIGIAIGAPVAPRIVEHIGTKIVVAAGLTTATISMFLLASRPVLEHDGILAVVFAIFGFGMGMVMAPATESIMGSVPRDQAGVGSAVNDTTRQTGGALGVAVLGSLFAIRYNAHINSLHLPNAATSAAKQSIGEALRMAPSLPGRAGEQLVNAAHAGFISGFQVATIFGAVIVALAATVVAVWLPAREAAPEDQPGSAKEDATKGIDVRR